MDTKGFRIHGAAIHRRAVLKASVAGAMAGVLAACGGNEATAPPATTAATRSATTAAQPTVTTQAAASAAAPQVTSPANAPVDWAAAAKPYQGRTVSVMTSAGPWGKGHAAVVDEFVKLTGIKMNMENVPEGDAFNAKRQSVLLSRSGTVDVVSLPFGEISQYTKGGILQDIGPFISGGKVPAFDMSDYSENVVNIFMKRDGKFYGIPASDGVQIMFYRKDLFDAAGLKPPKTWPEVYDAAKKLKQGDVWGAAWDAKGIYAFARVTNLLPKEMPTVDKDYRLAAFRDPQTIANVEIWQKLYKEGLAPTDTLANDLVATYALFQSGKAAMQPLGWIVGVAQMEDPAQSKVAGKVGYAPIPGLGPNLGGWSYVIPTDAKEKEAAYIFMSWLASKEVSAKQVTMQGNYDAVFHDSTFTDAFKQEILKRPGGAAGIDALQVASQSHPSARPAPLNIPEWGKVGPEMAPFIQKAIAGELSPKDGMNQAADAGEKILADAGYYKK